MSLPTPIELPYTPSPGAKLDLYLPPSHSASTPYKTLVFYHGGGLTTGTKRFFLPADLFSSLLSQEQQPYIIISADYTLLPDGSSTAFNILSDLSHLQSWLLENHTTYGIDLEKIAVAGASAGSYVAALAVEVWEKLQVKAFVNYYGMVDVASPFFTTKKMTPGMKLFGGMFELDALNTTSIARYFSPTLQQQVSVGNEELDADGRWGIFLYLVREGLTLDVIGGNWKVGEYEGPGLQGDINKVLPLEIVRSVGKERFPPVILVHGEEDTVVPVQGSLNFAKVLEQVGVEFELLVVKGAEHGLLPEPEKRVEELGRIVRFLEKHV